VVLGSTDPTAPPRIDHRYADVIACGDFEEAWTFFRELAASSSLVRAGVRIVDAGREFADILVERIGTASLGTASHPTGTCAIGCYVVGERAAAKIRDSRL
jgi:choline dehydrogenase-like flavoprotein